MARLVPALMLLVLALPGGAHAQAAAGVSDAAVAAEFPQYDVRLLALQQRGMAAAAAARALARDAASLDALTVLLAHDRVDDAIGVMRRILPGRRITTEDAQSPLEADVLAVRNAVFLPAGGGIYGNRGWNARSHGRRRCRDSSSSIPR